jgi:hypothetical protein
MLFSCFFRAGVFDLKSPLSGRLSHYRIYYSDALRYACLCVLIDIANILQLVVATDQRQDGAQFTTYYYTNKCG